jgi:hypothetical protein
MLRLWEAAEGLIIVVCGVAIPIFIWAVPNTDLVAATLALVLAAACLLSPLRERFANRKVNRNAKPS